jgi:hypothetical protein
MGFLLKFIPDSLKLPAAALAGALAAASILIVINAVWWLPAARSEGRNEERTAALQKSMELIKERGKTNAEIGKLTPADICRRLGGVWVPGNNLCE